MRTSFLARIALVTVTLGIAACDDNKGVTTTSCSRNSDCARFQNAVCQDGLCVLAPPNSDLAVTIVDFARSSEEIDFAMGGMGTKECVFGTKKCGFQPDGTTPKCIPNSACCTNGDCPAAGMTCQTDGSCQCPQGQRACNNICIPNANCCTNDDCTDKLCGALGTCLPAACIDGVVNGIETDIDCGGGFCNQCFNGRACNLPLDCRSNNCDKNVCTQPGFNYYTVGGTQNAIWLVSADFNNDKNIDIATVSQTGGNVSMLLNTGKDAQFLNLGSFAVGLQPTMLVTADFNGDSRPDVATVNQGSNNVTVLLGHGDGTFQPGITLPAGSGPTFIATGDANGDGRIDIVTNSANGGLVSVLYGKGTGQFITPPTTVLIGRLPSSVTISDVNKDGMGDLLATIFDPIPPVGQAQTYSIAVAIARVGGFKPVVTFRHNYTSNPAFIMSDDFNNDKNRDIAIGSNSNFLQILMGAGNGQFQVAGNVGNVTANMKQIIAVTPNAQGKGGLNADTNTDLLTPGGVMIGQGNGSFLAPLAFPNASTALSSITAADFNLDGNIDLAYTNNTALVNVLYGNNDGTFQTQNFVIGKWSGSQTNITYVLPRFTALEDLDGDQRADLLMLSGETPPKLHVMLANSDGTVQLPSIYNVGVSPNTTGLTVADFNGDKIPDVMVSNQTDQNMQLLLGENRGALKPAKAIATGGKLLLGVTSGDIDKDGKFDIVGIDTSSNAHYYFGDGAGGFKAPGTTQVGSGPRQVRLIDWDNDGYLDIVTSNLNAASMSFSIAVVNMMNGAVTYPMSATSVATGMGSRPTGFAIADYDGDGANDVVFTDLNSPLTPGKVGVLINLNVQGRIEFDPMIRFYPIASQPSQQPFAIVGGDFDNDGKPDVATANTQHASISVLSGRGNGQFKTPVNYDVGTGAGTISISAGDINGDKKLDFAAASNTSNTVSVFIAK